MMLWRLVRSRDSQHDVKNSEITCSLQRRGRYRLTLRRDLEVLASETYDSIHTAIDQAEQLRKMWTMALADTTDSANRPPNTMMNPTI